MKTQRWQLWKGEDNEPLLIAEFDTKNDAIRYAKSWLNNNESFHYNARYNVWADDHAGEGYTISNHGFPQD